MRAPLFREYLPYLVKIPEQALIGRIVSEICDKNVRERFVYSYRLIYRIKGYTITILAVIHGKRLLENMPSWFE